MVEIYHIKFLYFFLFRYGTQLSKLEFKEKVKVADDNQKSWQV